jgi:hypothetical protein
LEQDLKGKHPVAVQTMMATHPTSVIPEGGETYNNKPAPNRYSKDGN